MCRFNKSPSGAIGTFLLNILNPVKNTGGTKAFSNKLEGLNTAKP
jgi:hypothetical protein